MIILLHGHDVASASDLSVWLVDTFVVPGVFGRGRPAWKENKNRPMMNMISSLALSAPLKP